MSEKKPETVKVRARDVKPYHYAIWCSIGDGKPFANDIVSMRWSEDGKSIWFMLESHNFDCVKPDDIIDLIEVKDASSATLREKYASFKLGDPPKPKPTIESLTEQLKSAEAERDALYQALYQLTGHAESALSRYRTGSIVQNPDEDAEASNG